MTASTPSLGVLRVRDALFQWGSRTYVIGIINMTPDSFSGDGLAVDAEAAAAQAKRFVEEGADILDIGGESTRPGHTPIEAEEELKRVIPAVRAVREALPAVPISIDSFKSSVAAAALDAGADIINDQWGMQRDPDLGKLAATRGVPIILMHNQTGTNYADLMEDMVRSLDESCQRALAAGVPAAHIIVDPGIGFGKTWEQNLVVLRHLSALKRNGMPHPSGHIPQECHWPGAGPAHGGASGRHRRNRCSRHRTGGGHRAGPRREGDGPRRPDGRCHRPRPARSAYHWLTGA